MLSSSNSHFQAPLLNEYKQKFVLKRVLQTIFGGCILKFDYKVPAYVYIFQILLFFVPYVIGGIGVAIEDLVTTLDSTYVSLVCAGVYMGYLLTLKVVLQSISCQKYYASDKQNSSSSSGNGSKSTIKRTNILVEEDELEFDSCCALETISFFMPNLLNRSQGLVDRLLFVLRFFVDIVLAGFIMFCGVKFLSFAYLYTFYNIGGNIVVFIISWFIICIALYSLFMRDPPEPAISSTYYSSFDVKHLTRSFYVAAFYIIEVIYNYATSHAQISQTGIFWLKLVFLGLPLLWFFGVLPPIDIFFYYIIEQGYIYVYGGTATATYFRLLFQILLSVAISFVYFLPNDIAIVALLSAFGYLLSSLDLIHIFSSLYKLRKKRTRVEIIKDKDAERALSSLSMRSENKSSSGSNYKQIKWPDVIKLVIYHIAMLLLTLACSMLIFNLFTSYNMTNASAYQVEIALLYTCIGIYVICKVCADLQGVYIFFGLIRNPFYPKECLDKNYSDKQSTVNEKKVFFIILFYIRYILIKFVAPLMLCAVITIDCYINKIYGDATYGYMRTVFVLRAYRWIWQSTYSCLFEMSFLAHLLLNTILYNTTSDSTVQSALIQNYLPACFAASFIWDRFIQVVYKTFTFLLITITSWSMKSQKGKLALAFLIINFLLFLPYNLPIILLSSIFNASLLPLFTFPMFFIGYPRSKRFWPYQSSSTTSSQNSDSTFYAQLTPHLLASLKRCILSGSIGSTIEPDTYFISRFQDRIIWIQILEMSHSYCIVNIKGLELQETSCHTREAQYIDDSFETAFTNPDGAEANSTDESKKCLHTNPNKFDCMQSCDVMLFQAYSDAKNTLVGVLDSNESTKLISQYFPKLLHYFIIKHLIENPNSPKPTRNQSANHAQKFKSNSSTPFVKTVSNSVIADDSTRNASKITNTPSERKTGNDYSLPDINTTVKAKKINLTSKDLLPDWSDTDSIFSDIDDTKKPAKTKISNKKKDTPISADGNLFDFSTSFSPVTAKIDDDDAKSFSDTFDNEFELKLFRDKKSAVKIDEPLPKTRNFKFEELNSTQSPLGIPDDWISLMESIDAGRTDSKKDLRKSLGALSWLEKILEVMQVKKDNKVITEDVLKEYEINLCPNHFIFLLKCCNCLGINENNSSGSNAIYKLYKGDLPWSPVNEKLKQNKDLYKILLNSYRYAVKMVIDSLTIAPCENDEEFFDTLKTYEQEWFIGIENEEDFALNIKKNKPYLFSLYNDTNKKTINSRTLSIQQIKAPIARLNREIVKAIWSSTNIELLYMTNDDDERYSIQAHQYILRNLTIQASDAPLGYPIFNSKPIYISTSF